jgi:integrase
MSLEEEDKLFNLGLVGSRAHFRPIVRLGVHLGARLGELMAIKRADINLSTKPFFVKLLIPKSKNGKPRTIPLSNVAKEIFADLLGDEAGFDYVFANPDTGRPYTNVGKAFGAACREAGIQDLTFHDLRHTFASRLRRSWRRRNYEEGSPGTQHCRNERRLHALISRVKSTCSAVDC